MTDTTRSKTSLAAPRLTRRGLIRSAAAISGVSLIPAPFLTGAARAQDLTPFVHQLGWIKSVQFAGHFAAVANGYFAEEGIDAEFKAGGPSGVSPETAVATGQAMTADTGVDGTIRSRAGGLPIKAFAAIMQKAPGAIMSLTSNPIKTLEDFPGKTIALPDGVRPQVNALLTANGMDPSEVNYVPVGTDPGMLAAGQVDGYYGWATNQGVMLKVRGVGIDVAYMNDLGVPGYAGVLVATDESIETQRDLIVRWLKAEIKGWQWMLDNPDEAAKKTVEDWGQRGLDLQAQTVESEMYKDFIPVGAAAEHGLLWIEPEPFEQGLEFSVASGESKEGEFTVDDVMTQELIAEAHGA